MHRPSPTRTAAVLTLGALALGTAACGGDDDTAPPATAAPTAASSPGSTDGPAGYDPERCAANQAAGTITFASSYDFAASASIVEVMVAEANGYYDELCLDVELVPGFSSTNYPLIEAGEAHFSSAGNFTEILKYSAQGGEFVAVTNAGKQPIEAIVTPIDGAATIEELAGRTIGAKGDIPSSLVAMLSVHGLKRGESYKEILLEGFDPVSQLPQVDGLPVFKSNEPGQLDAAGMEYHLFDPADDGIPGTFGLIYTSRAFFDEHPTVVEDFTRASLKGLEDALADPLAAVDIAMERINAAGNSFFLTLEGETYRWTQESVEVLKSTPDGQPVGLIDGDLFRTEYDTYVEADVFPGGAPGWVEAFDPGPAAAAYGDDNKVIWPGP